MLALGADPPTVGDRHDNRCYITGIVPEEILVASDFSDASSNALGYAKSMAKRFGSHIVLVLRERSRQSSHSSRRSIGGKSPQT